MNTYIINSKVKYIKQAKQDLKDLYNIDYTPFTRKNFFYFFVIDGKKFVHKESLNFVNSNAETYTRSRDPFFCALKKEFEPFDIQNFLENYQGSLLPTMLENNDKFFVYEYLQGEPVVDINSTEFHILKEKIKDMSVTPFYNSMTYNLVRTKTDIKLVDFKHLEKKTEIPFFVYFYNKEYNINTLHFSQCDDLKLIKNILSVDYPIEKTNFIAH